jgi:hypothetical protein
MLWESFWLVGAPIGIPLASGSPDRRTYVAWGFICLCICVIQAFWALLRRERTTKQELTGQRDAALGQLAGIEASRPDMKIIFDRTDEAMWWTEERWCRITIKNDSAMAMAKNVKVRVMKMTPYLLRFKALPSRLGIKGEDNNKECSIVPKGTQLFDVFRWAPTDTDEYALWIVEGGQGFSLSVGQSCFVEIEVTAESVQPRQYVFVIDRSVDAGAPMFADITPPSPVTQAL